jgi:hypothetical protein
MDKLKELLELFSKTYSQFENVKITVIPYNYYYIAICLVDKVGDYIKVKKTRILNVIPKEIVMTDVAMNKKENELLFIFIHECSHGITPHIERKVKKEYIRIDHSRQFYISFFKLLQIAYDNKLIDYIPKNIKELMKKDNRKDNIKNDFRLYGYKK